jgi:hypothetical protein
MDRTYLFVPPEEKAEVQALGGQWDDESKRWYIGPNDTLVKFSRWLPSAEDDDPEDEEFDITSSQAFVASASVSCQQCDANIQVICIHCESGTASGEPLTQFTVSDIWAMDDHLTEQLRAWPNFQRIRNHHEQASNFANHCPHCGSPQEDLYLHSEPDTPFFDIPHTESGTIKLTPLTGTIRLSGSEHFTVE